MSGQEVGLALSVFTASLVECIEALTIVLAVGSTRSWPSALAGTGVAALVLAAVTALLGSALTALPLNTLRLIVGGLLLIFGLQWLRKAILRTAGLKAVRDESEEFAEETSAAAAAGAFRSGVDGYSFVIAMKGVLLEGLEVVFIILTFGANQNRVGLAAIAAILAAAVVIVAGLLLHRPLARAPENAMKFAVGVMLTSFGTFWGAEGAGAAWPGGDAALLALVPCVLLVSLGLTAVARRLAPQIEDGPGPIKAGVTP